VGNIPVPGYRNGKKGSFPKRAGKLILDRLKLHMLGRYGDEKSEQEKDRCNISGGRVSDKLRDVGASEINLKINNLKENLARSEVLKRKGAVSFASIGNVRHWGGKR